jgi:hypothetical protein
MGRRSSGQASEMSVRYVSENSSSEKKLARAIANRYREIEQEAPVAARSRAAT